MFSETELYNEIGKKIKKRRKELGLTQEKLADLTHYSDSFIANIESRTFQSFSLSALNTVAKALNTTMQELLPDNYLIPEKPNEIKCEYCKNITEIPIEIYKLTKCIENIWEINLKITCPKCKRKIVFN